MATARRVVGVANRSDGPSVDGELCIDAAAEVTMLDTLMQQFLGSGTATETVSALTQQGLSQPQATSALSATAEGAMQALGGGGGDGGGLGGLLGGGGAAALGGLLGGGGGGLGGALGGLLGGGGGSAPAGGGLGGALGGLLGGGGAGAALGGALGMNTTGLPGPVVDTITKFVVEKSGLDEAKARMAVNVVLPKLVEFVKAKMA
jgi:hypothetical protein